jgi:hypothetical protein
MVPQKPGQPAGFGLTQATVRAISKGHGDPCYRTVFRPRGERSAVSLSLSNLTLSIIQGARGWTKSLTCSKFPRAPTKFRLNRISIYPGN